MRKVHVGFVLVKGRHDLRALSTLVIVVGSFAVDVRQEISSIFRGITTLDAAEMMGSFVHVLVTEHVELERVFPVSKERLGAIVAIKVEAVELGEMLDEGLLPEEPFDAHVTLDRLGLVHFVSIQIKLVPWGVEVGFDGSRQFV